MDTHNALLEEFADLMGVGRDDAVRLLRASATALLAPVAEAGPGAQRSYLLPAVEAAAIEPPVETVAAAAAALESDSDALKALRAAAQVFLNQAQRDTALGLTAASSIVAEVNRASQLSTEAEIETAAAAEESPGSDVADTDIRYSRIGGDSSDTVRLNYGNSPHNHDSAPRGPHGSGGGMDD